MNIMEIEKRTPIFCGNYVFQGVQSGGFNPIFTPATMSKNVLLKNLPKLHKKSPTLSGAGDNTF